MMQTQGGVVPLRMDGQREFLRIESISFSRTSKSCKSMTRREHAFLSPENSVIIDGEPMEQRQKA